MKKKIDYSATILITLLGFAHTTLTPILAKQFNSNPLDFAAIGIAFIFLGFLNFSRLRTNEITTNISCVIANFLGIFWICFGFIHEESFTQGFLPLIDLCTLFVLSILDTRESRNVN